LGRSSEYSDFGEPLPLIPELPPPSLALAAKAKAVLRRPAPAPNQLNLWVEDVAFQVGNAAHEIRNTLRYWASLVTTFENKVLLRQFKQADNSSGNLEATMRALVGRVRNAPNVWHPMEILVPKGEVILKRVQSDLAALAGLSENVAVEQQRAVVQFLSRQQSYLQALADAIVAKTGPQAAGSPQEPLPLPPPGKRVDFGIWRQQETKFVADLKEAVDANQPIPMERVIGLARLACNAAHELQNLSCAPRGGLKTQAHQKMKQIDNIAGKCENASRATMVIAHKVHHSQKSKPTFRIALRAVFLEQAAERMGKLVDAAEDAPGGQAVPIEAYKFILQRLGQLAELLNSAVPPEHRRSLQELRAARKEAHASARTANLCTKCSNCDFTVTGVSPQHCCRACRKFPGTHGPKCQRQAVTVS